MVVLLIAAETSAGPVLWVLAGSHGVHLGDVVALGGAAAAAGALTRRLVRR
jgi:hypothetical protein